MIFVFSSRNFGKLSPIFTYFVCAGFITVVWHSLSLLQRQLQLPHWRKYRSADLYNFVWLWMFTLMFFWHMVSEKKMRNPLHTHANKNGLSYPACSRSKIKVSFFWDELWIKNNWESRFMAVAERLRCIYSSHYINHCESSLLRATLCAGHHMGRHLASILGEHTYYQVTAAWWLCHTAAAIQALHVMSLYQLHLSKHFGRKWNSTSHRDVYTPHAVCYRKVNLSGKLKSKV